jgi:hypothetical protein
MQSTSTKGIPRDTRLQRRLYAMQFVVSRRTLRMYLDTERASTAASRRHTSVRCLGPLLFFIIYNYGNDITDVI